MIRPVWWIPVGIFFVAGVVLSFPHSSGHSGILLKSYKALGPLFPIPLIISWFLAFVFYRLGRWATTKPIKKGF